jgi:hypothetical protein
MYARIVALSHPSEALSQRSRLKVHVVLQPRLDNGPTLVRGCRTRCPLLLGKTTYSSSK